MSSSLNAFSLMHENVHSSIKIHYYESSLLVYSSIRITIVTSTIDLSCRYARVSESVSVPSIVSSVLASERVLRPLYSLFHTMNVQLSNRVLRFH